MRYFNTAGPVVAADHYGIPPLQRLDLAEVLALIRQKKYFVLHAPRQSGKTSALLALRDLLNGGAEGAFRCVYCNVEGAGAMGDDVDRAMRTVLDEMAGWAEATLGDRFPDEVWPTILERSGPGSALRRVLTRWAAADDKLADKLQEERVRRVVEPLLSGGGGRARAHDLEYVRDLGWAAGAPTCCSSGRGGGSGRRRGALRSRVQGAARGSAADHRRGGGADRRLPGPVRRAGRPLGDLRPR